jgi:hypothetical protein
MALVGEVVAMGTIARPVHRGYRTVFELGSMERLMQSPAMGDARYGGIWKVSESIGIPMNTIRLWRRKLLQDRNWRGDTSSRHLGSCAINAQ